jgi:hypothetical protein
MLEAVHAAAASARANTPPATGLLAVIFGWDLLRPADTRQGARARVAVLPLAHGDGATGPAAQLLQRTSPAALSVHIVRAGDGSGDSASGGGGEPAAPGPSPFASAHAFSEGRVERASTVPACLQSYLDSAAATNWHGQGEPPLVLLDGAVGRADSGEGTLLDALTVCAEYSVPALVVWGELPPE